VKRLTFIRNISLAGAAAMLAPTMLATSSEKRIRLDQNVHVPHGNFFETEKNWVAVEEMDIECSMDQYLRNGVNAHVLDLQVLKIRRGNEVLLISSGKAGIRSIGSIAGLDLTGTKLASQTHVLELNSGSGFLTLSRKG
jgi:hypothetical protein